MSIKVLVADDSITIQKVIGIIFGGDEYSLTVVDNGKAAVDKALEITPDILLIDALMPGMTGYEVAELVRSTPSLAAKPILILTGSFEPFDEEKAKKCGADDFIAKPFESQQIIDKVKELLALGNARALSAPASQPQETLREEPNFDIFPPVIDKQPEAPPSDIWGAFTPAAEPSVESAVTPPATHIPPATAIEPDVFAIVSEEYDAQLVQTSTPSIESSQHTGSQWIPVEENTFEFEEEIIAEPLKPAFVEPTVPARESSFGEIAFEDDVAAPAAPVFSAVTEEAFADFAAPAPVFETPSAPATPFVPLSDPATMTFTTSEPVATATVPAAMAFAAPAEPVAVAAVPAAALTEEQLRAALAGMSKDVIERIVWEVVPDLAEALIREAIRKIKEGV